MMKLRIAIVTAFLSTVVLTGCGKPDSASKDEPLESGKPASTAEPVPSAITRNPEIEWFEGSIDEAFALSRSQNMPLFLYWGAVWCPPCVEIKQTVFKSPQFIAQSTLFIPVYLDGDTERAQVYGEKFDARVYPTMIVFNPAGEEVTRLHAGIEISAYNTVLELSLDSMRPTRELVEAALKNPESLSSSELQQLAYYSWYEGKALPENSPPELFNELSDVAAERNAEASARFYLHYLTMLADAQEGDDPPEPVAPEKLAAILADPELLVACWDYLISPESLMAAVDSDEASIETLQNQWAAAMRQQRHNKRLTTKNQLYGWRPYLVFHFQGDEEKARPLPADVAAAIRADGAAADQSVSGTHSRQSVINTVSNVYLLAGLSGDARTLLRKEIEASKTPYYFMGSLAHLEEQEGHLPEAVKWRRKAYEASTGPATRIRWWASYVQALTRMTPEDTPVIEQAAMELFSPSSGMGDFFSGANFRNLDRANAGLRKWNRDSAARSSALDNYWDNLQRLCVQQAPNSSDHSRCTSLLLSAPS